MNWEDRFGPEPDRFAAESSAPRELQFSFTGSGSEYFRIWIVNSLLNIVTVGIYSAWAKVRALQYFYRSTRLDGATFDYHGNPMAILKGRALFIVLVGSYYLVTHFSPALGVLMALVLAVVFPFLLVRSFRFRMANSSYRGLRFAFTGGDREGYMVFLLWPMLTAVSMYLLAPLAHQRLKRYQHNNTRFGTASFATDATAGAFYRVYLLTAGMAFVLLLVVGAVAGLVGTAVDGKDGIYLGIGAMLFGTYAAFLLIGPYLQAKVQNLVWNHTTLAPHRFRSNVKAGKLFVITITNLILTVLTLGLFRPFARVRSVRYRVESMTMLAVGNLDTFLAGEREQVDALGDAAVDWYDIDIAL